MPVHSLHTAEVSCSVQGRFGHAGAFSAKKVNSFHSESYWNDRTLTSLLSRKLKVNHTTALQTSVQSANTN